MGMMTHQTRKKPAASYTIGFNADLVKRLRREIRLRKDRLDGIRTIKDYIIVALIERLDKDESERTAQ